MISSDASINKRFDLFKIDACQHHRGSQVVIAERTMTGRVEIRAGLGWPASGRAIAFVETKSQVLKSETCTLPGTVGSGYSVGLNISGGDSHSQPLLAETHPLKESCGQAGMADISRWLRGSGVPSGSNLRFAVITDPRR